MYPDMVIDVSWEFLIVKERKLWTEIRREDLIKSDTDKAEKGQIKCISIFMSED